MASKQNPNTQSEHYMTIVILSAFAFYIVFLTASGFGVTWLKVSCAVLTLLISTLSFIYLYLTKQWLRRRILWMSIAAMAMVVCTLLSLLLQFPSPTPT